MNARHIQCLMTGLAYGIHSQEIHGRCSNMTAPVGPACHVTQSLYYLARDLTKQSININFLGQITDCCDIVPQR